AALGELLILGFYAFKDARTPLFVNILGLVTRWSLLALLVRLLTSSHAILAVPLALTGAGLVEALLLGNLLYLRLRSKVKTDKAVPRLERRRPRHETKRKRH